MSKDKKPQKPVEKDEAKEQPPEEEVPDPEVEKRYWQRTMADDDGFEEVGKKAPKK